MGVDAGTQPWVEAWRDPFSGTLPPQESEAAGSRGAPGSRPLVQYTNAQLAHLLLSWGWKGAPISPGFPGDPDFVTRIRKSAPGALFSPWLL